MDIESLHRRVLECDDSHPAKRFLQAFLHCKQICVGRHYDFNGQEAVEQTWTSSTDGRTWTFSGFAYAFLSLDIVLDGFLEDARVLTSSEIDALRQVPVLQTMMEECAEAADYCGNGVVHELSEQVLKMLRLWQEYLDYRKEVSSRPVG